MAAVTKDFIIEKLKLFYGEDKAKEAFTKAAVTVNIGAKADYSKDEMTKILDTMVSQGGYYEFVARNAKIMLSVK